MPANNHYAAIDTEAKCYAVYSVSRTVSRENFISLPSHDDSYLGKYHYDSQWWERVWNEYETVEVKDGSGEVIQTYEKPVESAGYVDTPWTPESEVEVQKTAYEEG